MIKAINVKPTAIHMKANILVPTSTCMLRSVCDVKAYLKTKDMAVPMAAATVTMRKAKNENRAMGRLHQRE